MGRLGTTEDLLANLNLIDDAKSPPVPRGVWEQLENAFVERQPYGDSPHVFTLHARASNKLRTRLFTMVREDRKRRHSASMLLGQIEAWRLEHGNRNVLSKVMGRLGTTEDLLANLNLIDDAKSPPVPRGVWEQLENAFVERQPYGDSPHVFTLHARASNKLRTRLFTMVREDRKRRHSASMLLGQIEAWRLEHGRPMDEPRHPDLASGQSWPPRSFDYRP